MATEEKLDLIQGTLDLMVLRTLATMGSLHAVLYRGRVGDIREQPARELAAETANWMRIPEETAPQPHIRSRTKGHREKWFVLPQQVPFAHCSSMVRTRTPFEPRC